MLLGPESCHIHGSGFYDDDLNLIIEIHYNWREQNEKTIHSFPEIVNREWYTFELTRAFNFWSIFISLYIFCFFNKQFNDVVKFLSQEVWKIAHLLIRAQVSPVIPKKPLLLRDRKWVSAFNKYINPSFGQANQSYCIYVVKKPSLYYKRKYSESLTIKF